MLSSYSNQPTNSNPHPAAGGAPHWTHVETPEYPHDAQTLFDEIKKLFKGLADFLPKWEQEKSTNPDAKLPQDMEIQILLLSQKIKAAILWEQKLIADKKIETAKAYRTQLVKEITNNYGESLHAITQYSIMRIDIQFTYSEAKEPKETSREAKGVIESLNLGITELRQKAYAAEDYFYSRFLKATNNSKKKREAISNILDHLTAIQINLSDCHLLNQIAKASSPEGKDDKKESFIKLKKEHDRFTNSLNKHHEKLLRDIAETLLKVSALIFSVLLVANIIATLVCTAAPFGVAVGVIGIAGTVVIAGATLWGAAFFEKKAIKKEAYSVWSEMENIRKTKEQLPFLKPA